MMMRMVMNKDQQVFSCYPYESVNSPVFKTIRQSIHLSKPPCSYAPVLRSTIAFKTSYNLVMRLRVVERGSKQSREIRSREIKSDKKVFDIEEFERVK